MLPDGTSEPVFVSSYDREHEYSETQTFKRCLEIPVVRQIPDPAMKADIMGVKRGNVAVFACLGHQQDQTVQFLFDWGCKVHGGSLERHCLKRQPDFENSAVILFLKPGYKGAALAYFLDEPLKLQLLQ